MTQVELQVGPDFNQDRQPHSRVRYSTAGFREYTLENIRSDLTSTARTWISMDTATQRRIPRTPVLGVGDVLGAGDSYLVTNMLPPELADIAFEQMRAEVGWTTKLCIIEVKPLCLESSFTPLCLNNRWRKYQDLWQ